jgi:hypothetical protein
MLDFLVSVCEFSHGTNFEEELVLCPYVGMPKPIWLICATGLEGTRS